MAAVGHSYRQQQQRTPSPVAPKPKHPFSMQDAGKLAGKVDQVYREREVLRELHGQALTDAPKGRKMGKQPLIHHAKAHPNRLPQLIPPKKPVAFKPVGSITKFFPEVRTQAFETPLCLKHPLDEICPHLFLGELSAYQKLADNEICYIVNATLDHIEDSISDGVKVLKVGAPDIAAEWKQFLDKVSGAKDTASKEVDVWFQQTFAFIDQALNEKKNILIHCAAGVSRSATIVIAYLMSRKELSLDQALATVYQKRPWIQPNNGFIQMLKKFERKLKKVAAEKKEAPVVNLLKPLSDYEKAEIIKNEKGGALLLGRSQDYDQLLKEHPKPSQTLRVIRFCFPDDSLLPQSLGKESICNVILNEKKPKGDDFYWNSMLAALRKIGGPQADSQHPFEALFAKMDRWLIEGKQVFVQCSDSFDSTSFSSSLVIAYLMDRFNLPFEKAIAFAKSKQPLVNLNYQFREGLVNQENTLLTPKGLPLCLVLNKICKLIKLPNKPTADTVIQELIAIDRKYVQVLYSQFARLRRIHQQPLSENDTQSAFHGKHVGVKENLNAQDWELEQAAEWAHLQISVEGLQEAQNQKQEKQERLYYTVLSQVHADACEFIEKSKQLRGQNFQEAIASFHQKITN